LEHWAQLLRLTREESDKKIDSYAWRQIGCAMVLSLDICKYSIAHRLSKLEIRTRQVHEHDTVLRVGQLGSLFTLPP
jgi:hypothetical protein